MSSSAFASGFLHICTDVIWKSLVNELFCQRVGSSSNRKGHCHQRRTQKSKQAVTDLRDHVRAQRQRKGLLLHLAFQVVVKRMPGLFGSRTLSRRSGRDQVSGCQSKIRIPAWRELGPTLRSKPPSTGWSGLWLALGGQILFSSGAPWIGRTVMGSARDGLLPLKIILVSSAFRRQAVASSLPSVSRSSRGTHPPGEVGVVGMSVACGTVAGWIPRCSLCGGGHGAVLGEVPASALAQWSAGFPCIMRISG